MANLNINITRPTISLITRVRESQNKCEKVLTFTIKSTPNATIDLMGFIVDEAPIGAFTDDYIRDFSVDKGSGFVRVPDVASLPSGIIASDGKYYRHLPFSLNSTGEAKVRMILENNGSPFLNSSKARVIVSDTTNNKVATKTFINYSTNVRCQLGLEPEAVDDIYDITIETGSILNILKNDVRTPDTGYSLITIEQQPSHGTIEVLDRDVIYTPLNATNLQSDSFTYSVETMRGYSNIATVTLNEAIPICENGIDLAIVLDTTGSMQDSIDDVKNSLNNIINKLINKFSNNYRISLTTVTDGSKKYSPEVQFELNNKTAIQNRLNTLNAVGGNGVPEPNSLAINGVIDGESGEFRDNISKVIILITDAPPSGSNDDFDNNDIIYSNETADKAALNNIQVFPMITDYTIETFSGMKELYDYYASATGGKSYYLSDGVINSSIEDSITQIGCK
jgi:hypothetical protein